MSRLTAWIAALLILIGSVWSQEQILEEGIEEARFGFNFLEPLRRSFCQNFCTSFETMPYIANLACAVKCPELYLPHTTAQSTATQTATPLPITTTQNPLTTPPTVATTKTSPPTSAPTMTTAASPSTTMTPTTMA